MATGGGTDVGGAGDGTAGAGAPTAGVGATVGCAGALIPTPSPDAAPLSSVPTGAEARSSKRGEGVSRGSAGPTPSSGPTARSGIKKPRAGAVRAMLLAGAAPAVVSADWPVEGPPPSSRNEPTTKEAMPAATSSVRRAAERLGGAPDGS